MNVIDFTVRVWWRRDITVGVGIDDAGLVVDMDASDESNGWDHLTDLVSRGFVVRIGVRRYDGGLEIVHQVLREYRRVARQIERRVPRCLPGEIELREPEPWEYEPLAA